MPKYVISSDEADFEFTRGALRNSLTCLAVVKMCSVSCYVFLYFMVLRHTPGKQHWAAFMTILILVVISLTIVLAFLLVAVAWTESQCIITATIGVAALLALIDLFLSAFAAVYYIRFGHQAGHFLLAATFICLGLSYIPVIANDWYLIYSYKKLMNCARCG